MFVRGAARKVVVASSKSATVGTHIGWMEVSEVRGEW